MLATENSCTWLKCCQYQRKHWDWEFLINIFMLVNTENSSWWCWSWWWRWRWRWQWHYLDICQSKSHRGDCCHGDLSKIKSPHNFQLSEGKSRHLVEKQICFHKLQSLWYDKLKEPPSVEFLIFQMSPPLLPGFDPALCLNRASDELSPKQIKL